MKRSDIKALQLERLKYTVEYAYNHVAFYHNKFDEMNIQPEKVKQLSDVQYLPLTTKDDLRDTYPYGLMGVALKKIVRIHASSGTTGKPIIGAYTKKDLDNWGDQVARFCVAAGITEDDLIQISFGYGLFTGALGLHYGLEKIGCGIIPASSGNTERQLMLLKDLGVTALVATPSYALYMSELAKADPQRDQLQLKIGLLGSEGYTPQMRTRIENGFRLTAFDNYGLTELNGPGVAGECHLRCGLHFAEDHFLPEIIDSDTGSIKEQGEVGELVITTLTKEGLPMIRYRTKDITRLNYEECACGRTHVRMDKVMGRSDDMLIIKGVNVFPSQIESVLMSMKHIGSHYQLIIRRDKSFMDTLEVKVEVIDGALLDRFRELEQLQMRVQDKLKSVLQLKVTVTLVEPNTLQRFEGKAKRILDLRNK